LSIKPATLFAFGEAAWQVDRDEVKMKILIVDNYDSFTFNLYQLAAETFGTLPVVVPNDHDFSNIAAQAFDAVIISPGPGSPVNDTDFGISKNVIREMNVPVLGVCLGHQGICHLMGGSVVHAPIPMHGREDRIYHTGTGLFENVPNPFVAVRYHSLVVPEPLPECLIRTAWTADGLLMGIAHKTRPLWGVQFHPESICSTFGQQIMANFRRLAEEFHSTSRGDLAASGPVGSSLKIPAATSSTPMLERHMFVRRSPARQTAEQIFERAFNQEPYAFWLDSSLTREPDARFSFLGGYSAGKVECIRYHAHNRRLSIRHGDLEELGTEDLFPYLKRRLTATRVTGADVPFNFDGGFVGYFGYELKAVCGAQAAHRSQHPDFLALLATQFVAIDHFANEMYLVFIGESTAEVEALAWFDQIEMAIAVPAAAAPSEARSRADIIQFAPVHSESQYLDNINHVMHAIGDGETYEVCLTNQITANTSVDAFEYYKKLRQLNPAPYASFLKFPELSVACSSPERFLKIDRDATVEAKPIKGTSRRGLNQDEDDLLRRSLAEEEKSRSENLMIVDLLRNDLGRVCEVGSIHVPKLMHVETYATVHQLVTTIRGKLANCFSSADCLEAAFPGGSMTGAPKIRTMEIIDELEGRARGIYSGSIGFLSFNGCADLNIVIRTAVFSKNAVTIGVGGAIVALSDPYEEWMETLLKAKALLATFEALNKTVLLMNRPVGTYGKTIDLSKRVG
jgi:para-aminobenzoate synthetase